MKLVNDRYWEERREALAGSLPGSRFGLEIDLTAEAVDAFEDALLAESEEAIQKVLTAHPFLIQYAVPQSGHHGIWAYPKQMIRPRSAAGDAGMIPDFLIMTRSSLGDWWHVVELKRFDEQFSDAKGVGYSSAGHRAVAQCNGYLSHFRDYIDAVRVNARISRLTQPTSAIILIGDADKETDEQRQVRANFVRSGSKIDVVSYRRILMAARGDVGFTARGPGIFFSARKPAS